MLASLMERNFHEILQRYTDIFLPVFLFILDGCEFPTKCGLTVIVGIQPRLWIGKVAITLVTEMIPVLQANRCERNKRT